MKDDVFIFQLQKFASGATSVDDFQRFIDYVLVSDGPAISRGDDGELSAQFSFAAEAAMYLDMVNNIGPNQDEQESRRLAASLAELGAQVGLESAGLLAPFARWSPETVRRSRAYLAGDQSRASFETFISRRPWPDRHKAVIKQLPRERLASFVGGLEADDFMRVANAVAGEIAEE